MDFAAASALFGQIDPPLWLATACAGRCRGGLVATFVCKASLVPELPRVVVGLAQQHRTWELIEASGAFALHLLDEKHLSWVWRFGLRSGREFDKFSGLPMRDGSTGVPLLEGVPGWLECRVEARLDTGDRTLYLADVVESKWTRDVVPLTFKRLLKLANSDQLRQLKEQEQHDIAVDAGAIRAWRRKKQHRPDRDHTAPPVRPDAP